ncbi:photosystem II assembly protein Psb34 [Leptothoe kymatousa]|uniref:Ssl1498 family light-harvesting-like protein n=1 Tax=Leptothoe kymatousa TAU-MAC 1615 TaxID=2364775 RepID=A0ABS5Y320_9CYAN|nr:ssl1498 family light-harvesting-like protein [Leptothoe kymatousa]MBT9311759.1 ssl1498 family light-harvesting-like protein [Leptothoe kymatousa TAU-MAC 1615]
MPYTTEEGGRLNNFASEPKMYEAEPPTSSEKRNYLIFGILGASLVVGLIAITAVVS